MKNITLVCYRSDSVLGEYAKFKQHYVALFYGQHFAVTPHTTTAVDWEWEKLGFLENKKVCTGRYVITHINSGRCLPGVFQTAQQALEVIHKLESMPSVLKQFEGLKWGDRWSISKDRTLLKIIGTIFYSLHLRIGYPNRLPA